MDVHKLLRRVEELRSVDGVGASIANAVRRATKRSEVDGALRGSWLGHPVHPIVVTVPIGAWVCAAVLDVLPGNRDAARKLVGFGLLATPAAALLGLADYAELDERQRRVGVAHALTNVVAAAFFTASYASGNHAAARGWGLLGLTALGMGGALGGHLAYALGAGVHRWQT
jgi:hypothetical protein